MRRHHDDRLAEFDRLTAEDELLRQRLRRVLRAMIQIQDRLAAVCLNLADNGNAKDAARRARMAARARSTADHLTSMLVALDRHDVQREQERHEAAPTGRLIPAQRDLDAAIEQAIPDGDIDDAV